MHPSRREEEDDAGFNEEEDDAADAGFNDEENDADGAVGFGFGDVEDGFGSALNCYVTDLESHGILPP